MICVLLYPMFCDKSNGSILVATLDKSLNSICPCLASSKTDRNGGGSLKFRRGFFQKFESSEKSLSFVCGLLYLKIGLRKKIKNSSLNKVAAPVAPLGKALIWHCLCSLSSQMSTGSSWVETFRWAGVKLAIKIYLSRLIGVNGKIVVVARAMSFAIFCRCNSPRCGGEGSELSSVVGSLNDASALKCCSLTPVPVSVLRWI